MAETVSFDITGSAWVEIDPNGDSSMGIQNRNRRYPVYLFVGVSTPADPFDDVPSVELDAQGRIDIVGLETNDKVWARLRDTTPSDVEIAIIVLRATP